MVPSLAEILDNDAVVDELASGLVKPSDEVARGDDEHPSDLDVALQEGHEPTFD